MTIEVEAFFRALWGAREEARGRIDAEAVPGWGRRMAAVMAADVAACPDYNPEADNRILWAREVLQAARRRDPGCRARGELEAAADFLLGVTHEPCGKDLAAGVDR